MVASFGKEAPRTGVVLLHRKLTILAIPGVNGCKLWQGSTTHRCSPPLAVGEVPQELIEAVVAETTSQGAVLHLLMAEHHHRWVTKSTHINRLLELGLSHGLHPQPAPVFLLVLLTQLLQVVNVAISAGSVAVKDMWKE